MLRFRETRSKPDVNLAFPERKENGAVEGEKKMGKEEVGRVNERFMAGESRAILWIDWALTKGYISSGSVNTAGKWRKSGSEDLGLWNFCPCPFSHFRAGISPRVKVKVGARKEDHKILFCGGISANCLWPRKCGGIHYLIRVFRWNPKVVKVLRWPRMQ